MAVLAGADIVRVHDVAETVQALRVLRAIEQARDMTRGAARARRQCRRRARNARRGDPAFRGRHAR